MLLKLTKENRRKLSRRKQEHRVRATLKLRNMNKESLVFTISKKLKRKFPKNQRIKINQIVSSLSNLR